MTKIDARELAAFRSAGAEIANLTNSIGGLPDPRGAYLGPQTLNSPMKTQQKEQNTEPSTDSSTLTFEAETTEVLHRLRTSIAEIVAVVPGNASSPTELQRILKIDMNLCCKVFKVVAASGPLAAGQNLPGIMAIRMFLKSAAKAGVSNHLVETASQAADEFDRLVTTRAGDRPMFDSMVCSLVGNEDALHSAHRHRRAAFRAQRHIIGLQAKVQLKCVVIDQTDDSGRLDITKIEGFVSLSQLRSNAFLVLPRAQSMNDDGTAISNPCEPLDSRCDPSSGSALLKDHCSKPTPRIVSAGSGLGGQFAEVQGYGIGKDAAMTIIEGRKFPKLILRYRGDMGNHVFANYARVSTPCESLIIDTIVKDGIFESIEPKATVHAEYLGDLPSVHFREAMRLDVQASVSCLGKGPSALYSSDVPAYPDLGRYIFKQLGADGQKFSIYRCRVDYPVLPSSVVVAFDLPYPP